MQSLTFAPLLQPAIPSRPAPLPALTHDWPIATEWTDVALAVAPEQSLLTLAEPDNSLRLYFSDGRIMTLLRLLLLPRKMMLAIMLVSAVAVSYFSTDGKWQQWKGWARSKVSRAKDTSQPIDWSKSFGSSSSTESVKDSKVPTVTSTVSLKDLPSELTGPKHQSLEDVVRFDRSPNWVTQTWSRVTTVLAEVELEGLRVPLVTGTKLTDFAGSATYYFDRQHRVQRIVLEGSCGDTGMFEQFAEGPLKLKKRPTLAAGLYTHSWNGTVKSALKLSHAPVVRSNSPFTRYAVYMEVNHPSSRFGMSPEGRNMLRRDRQTWRW
ncbi:MAG TPA: hypothetical protein EYG57_16160 [Planctomycetes bacterium]|nr:hypothetical protein [Planctomycetaceae bacterium]HIM31069.1 hypothetical protein [Planctomycetota bacterium]